MNLWLESFRDLRGTHDVYSWLARAARHAAGVTPERVQEIAADEAEMAATLRLTMPNEGERIFQVSEALKARIAAFEAEGLDWRDGV
ncbi:hypothetical protein D8770_21815 [Methylobacterium sp. DB1607]|nr:hypothetical protein [Methylobacterium sp. DB1607]